MAEETGFIADNQRRQITLMVALAFFCWCGFHLVGSCVYFASGWGYFARFSILLNIYFMTFAAFTAIQMTEGDTGLGKFKGFVSKVCPMYCRHGRRAVLYTVWIALYSVFLEANSFLSLLSWAFSDGAGSYNTGTWITLVISCIMALAWWFLIFVEIVNYVKKGEGKEGDTAEKDKAVNI